MKILKKYQNRKLYDAELHKYVTLKDIIKLVKENKEFTIIDKNNRDITTRILLSAIVDNVIIDETIIRNLINYGETNGN